MYSQVKFREAKQVMGIPLKDNYTVKFKAYILLNGLKILSNKCPKVSFLFLISKIHLTTFMQTLN